MDDVDSVRASLSEQGIEGCFVTFFCGACEPVGRTDLLRYFECERNVLSFDGPHWMHHHEFIVGKVVPCSFTNSVAHRGVDIETVADGRRSEASVKKLLACEFIDCDVAPLPALSLLTGREFSDIGVAVALPRRIVVMPDRWEALTGSGHSD
ncbi:unannotated protein [freshwater metagenome]|uniref:Unannotated protein n=1 Tax=freshwater metagenome TaxID=449393 RepID=A0A6J7KZG1_9ZZZZ